MSQSRLSAILKRLEAMTESQDSEVQVRRFEKEGDERCVVSYDGTTGMFELTETANHQTYEFDDIDLVAMEIYELID